jgi:hypothetical protein
MIALMIHGNPLRPLQTAWSSSRTSWMLILNVYFNFLFLASGTSARGGVQEVG